MQHSNPVSCRLCKYDLSGVPPTNRCPECGASALEAANDNAWISSRRAAVLYRACFSSWAVLILLLIAFLLGRSVDNWPRLDIVAGAFLPITTALTCATVCLLVQPKLARDGAGHAVWTTGWRVLVEVALSVLVSSILATVVFIFMMYGVTQRRDAVFKLTFVDVSPTATSASLLNMYYIIVCWWLSRNHRIFDWQDIVLLYAMRVIWPYMGVWCAATTICAIIIAEPWLNRCLWIMILSQYGLLVTVVTAAAVSYKSTWRRACNV